MPLYEYRCTECGEKFEKLVRMADADRAPECPKCGAPEAKRQVSAFGFVGFSAGRSSAESCAPSFSGG